MMINFVLAYAACCCLCFCHYYKAVFEDDAELLKRYPKTRKDVLFYFICTVIVIFLVAPLYYMYYFIVYLINGLKGDKK